jgi:hypothetical protein
LPAAQHGTPPAGFFELQADPPVAAERLSLAWRRADDEAVFPETYRFEPGERIVAAGASVTGSYEFVLNGRGCTGVLDLTAGTTTDLLLRPWTSEGCSISVERVRAGGPDEAGIGGRVTSDIARERIEISLRSLSDPPNPVPDPIHPDESDVFVFFGVAPGPYELVATVDETKVYSRVLSVGSGEEPFIDLEL